MKRKTREEFIEQAIDIHGKRYNYSLVDYTGTKNKVIIICKEHGKFTQSPSKHLAGQGCNECSGRIKPTIANFISRANKVHNNKYDYSESKFKIRMDKAKIICPIHGEFYQSVNNHLRGQGCPKCGQISVTESQRYTKEEFIKSVTKVHGNKYDYSNSEYINSQTKISIVCPEHGTFKMKPNSHFNGQGCPRCGQIKRNKSLVLEYGKFLKRAIKIHAHEYIYDEESYTNYTTKIRIFCSTHGWFEQTPHSHISMKTGCPICGQIKKAESCRKNWEEVLELFKTTHGDKYDYTKVDYEDVLTKIKITCSKHGVFEQSPRAHYRGNGCPDCGYEVSAEQKRISYYEFLKRAKQKHGNFYDYSNVDYIEQHTKVEIHCPKHGVFEQSPRAHCRGAGCPKCISSHGENSIRIILKSHEINFKEQKKFDDLVHKSYLKCDFYLPDYNTVIEYNGRQHYKPIKFFGGVKGLEQTQLRDIIKYDFLKENSINLIIVKHDIEDIESHIFNSLEDA